MTSRGSGDDQGAADPHLLEAILQGDPSRVVEVLRNTRVLVALAESSVVEYEQGPGEAKQPDNSKRSDLSVVCMSAADGRIGLLVFTSVASMKNWNAAARPVPITGVRAGIAALDESASALIIDLAGPTPFTLALPDLVDLTGEDQRWRAVAQIQQELDAAGVDAPEFTLPVGGPVVVGSRSDLVQQIAEILSGRGDIHAFTPHGIAIAAIDR